VAGVPPIATVGIAWALLGEPPAREDAALCVLAGCALLALPRRPRWWAVSVPLLGLALVSLTAWQRPDRALALVARGTDVAPSVKAPFQPDGQPALAALALLVCFGLMVAIAALLVGRRPLAAGVVSAVAVAWPATLTGQRSVAWGCTAVAVALWPSAALRARGALGAVTAGLALAASLAFVAVAGAQGFGTARSSVDWRGWDPLGAGQRVGVGYVWDARYSGVRFPRRPTELLRITAPPEARYWRASTLDVFADDRWIENLYPILIGSPRRTLPDDPLLPEAAREADAWVRQTVRVVALDDRRLVGAAQPVRVESRRIDDVFFLSGGVMLATGSVRPGDEYTIWSYAPRPQVRALVGSPPAYPDAAGRYLDLGRARFPAFGERGREDAAEAIFGDERFPDIGPYRPLWREARRLTAGTGSPYLATLAVERWLRSAGGYVYDEQPPAPPPSVPPLVDFAVGARTGYCQHFAGTMALMLRTLGIPARVAVGFTSGERDGEEWVVTDYQAHAWVEAWFAGVGWLPFDPTPGRGTFATSYSYAADSADAVRALGTGRLLDFTPEPRDPVEAQAPAAAVEEQARAARRPWWLLALVLLPGAWIALAWLLKRRRWHARLREPDPRLRADAIRRELADTLRDHGVVASRSTSLATLLASLERDLRLRGDALRGALVTARYGPPAVAARAADDAVRDFARLQEEVARSAGPFRTLRALARPGTLRGR
jgi:transglutaminase-like putative cysteine protease